jgi:hypothetical protein
MGPCSGHSPGIKRPRRAKSPATGLRHSTGFLLFLFEVGFPGLRCQHPYFQLSYLHFQAAASLVDLPAASPVMGRFPPWIHRCGCQGCAFGSPVLVSGAADRQKNLFDFFDLSDNLTSCVHPLPLWIVFKHGPPPAGLMDILPRHDHKLILLVTAQSARAGLPEWLRLINKKSRSDSDRL